MHIRIPDNFAYGHYMHEADDIVPESKEDKLRYIHDKLTEIANNMDCDYIEKTESNLGSGTIDISDDVSISIEYTRRPIQIYLLLGKNSNRRSLYNCSTNSTLINQISQQLQKASMVIDNIRKKLK